MEVIIDQEDCRRCQLCVDACPEVFALLKGKVVTLIKDVPLAFETDCLYARDVCTMQAIEIRNTEGVFRDVRHND